MITAPIAQIRVSEKHLLRSCCWTVSMGSTFLGKFAAPLHVLMEIRITHYGLARGMMVRSTEFLKCGRAHDGAQFTRGGHRGWAEWSGGGDHSCAGRDAGRGLRGRSSGRRWGANDGAHASGLPS